MAYKEIEDTIVKFIDVGDFVEGIYRSKEEGAMYGNEVYKLENEEGKFLTVFSTTVLSSLMQNVKIGDKIKIELTELKPNSKKGLNPIKVFKLYKDE